jgi:hypothetical protein
LPERCGRRLAPTILAGSLSARRKPSAAEAYLENTWRVLAAPAEPPASTAPNKERLALACTPTGSGAAARLR